MAAEWNTKLTGPPPRATAGAEQFHNTAVICQAEAGETSVVDSVTSMAIATAHFANNYGDSVSDVGTVPGLPWIQVGQSCRCNEKQPAMRILAVVKRDNGPAGDPIESHAVIVHNPVGPGQLFLNAALIQEA